MKVRALRADYIYWGTVPTATTAYFYHSDYISKFYAAMPIGCSMYGILRLLSMIT